MPDRALQPRNTVALPLRPPPYNRRTMALTANTHTRRTAALAALGCAVLLAACGSSSSNRSGSASLSVSTGVKYADCMRSHGVSNFPDPGTSSAYQLLQQINQSSPAFESAQNACAKYGDTSAPVDSWESGIPELVQLARCMRAHGVPNFPDPASTSAASHQLLAESGIEPHSPAFKHAATACGAPGLLGS
jgi:hypothetical protein